MLTDTQMASPILHDSCATPFTNTVQVCIIGSSPSKSKRMGCTYFVLPGIVLGFPSSTLELKSEDLLLEMLAGCRDADSTIREVRTRFPSCFYLFPIEVDLSL